MGVVPASRVGGIALTRDLGLAAIVLLLAAFNVGYRLDRESVGEWDESLYATSAWEMSSGGHLVATTFNGQLDYSNSKPPLQVWILAGSFRLFGVNLLSLRVASAVCAWLTVLLVMWWGRRLLGPSPALVAGLVLATSFGWLHLHAGRSGNPDALLALLVTTVVVVLSMSGEHPWRRVWLGPLLAGVFLLKGPAVLLPLAIIVAVEFASAPTGPRRWQPYAVAVCGFAVPVTAWVVARWRVDGWQFFHYMVAQDLVGLGLAELDERGGPAWYYLDVLQKHSFDWLAAAVVSALALRRHSRGAVVDAWDALRARGPLPVLIVAWVLATLVAPSLLQTKVVWYLNPFYPLFALGVGWLVTSALADMRRQRSTAWLALVATAAAVALLSAEARTLWRLHVVTSLDRSVQGLLLSNPRFRSRRVHRDRLQRSEAFVVRAMMGGDFDVLTNRDVPLGAGVRRGDLLVLSFRSSDPRLRRIGEADGQFVYEAIVDEPRESDPDDVCPG